MNSALISRAVTETVESRWASSEDFYCERDDRTLRGDVHPNAYTRRRVEILIDPETARSKATQQIALVACNLAARWARSINIVLPVNVPIREELCRGRFAFLEQRILFEMREADPFGDFEIVPADNYENRRDKSTLRLFIGPWRAPSTSSIPIDKDDYLVTAAGPYAIGRRGRSMSSPSPCGHLTASAGLAASIGVADLFKRAVGHSQEHWIPSFNWDLLDHSMPREIEHMAEGADEPDIGNVLLAGVGAIGSSLVYLLDLAAANGRVTLLDRDLVETSNLNRSLLFGVSDVLVNGRKTELAERFLRSTDISTTCLNGTWREHAVAVSAANFDVWVSFTNEDGAWAQVPFQLPPVVLQGTTTSGWGFGAGRHIPRKEDCTLCRMPRAEAAFRGPCAEGEISQAVPTSVQRASLPFLSAASASLVLAELGKLRLPGVDTLPNDIGADLKTGIPAIIATKRRPDDNCRGCRLVRSDLWDRRGGRGRHRMLSE